MRLLTCAFGRINHIILSDAILRQMNRERVVGLSQRPGAENLQQWAQVAKVALGSRGQQGPLRGESDGAGRLDSLAIKSAAYSF
jgi:hypothetical protein